MTVYLLDKNIVEDIKHSLNGVSSEHIAVAREVDVKRYLVSPLLAALEGDNGAPQSASELYDRVNEYKVLTSRFYKNAKTDRRSLDALDGEVALLMSSHIKQKIEPLIDFMMHLQSELAKTYSVAQAMEKVLDIAQSAREHHVSFDHPLVGCALACLFGHVAARRTLKTTIHPSSQTAFNALFDLRLLLEVAYIRKIWQRFQPWRQVKIHTRDGYLDALSRDLHISVSDEWVMKGVDSISVSFRFVLKDQLFPSIAGNKKKMAAFLGLISDCRREGIIIQMA